jgi:peroxiredoxin
MKSTTQTTVGIKSSSAKGNRSLAESRINRSGLSDGTPAPNFNLPSLDGKNVSLQQFLGRRVLLVFSDPSCGPCNSLTPRLERLSRRTPDIQIIMVSRGDIAVNRAKVAHHGLTFPVVLQRSWELSRRFEMFATPIAYYVDQQGVIRGNIAVGLEQIKTVGSCGHYRITGRDTVVTGVGNVQGWVRKGDGGVTHMYAAGNTWETKPMGHIWAGIPRRRRELA